MTPLGGLILQSVWRGEGACECVRVRASGVSKWRENYYTQPW